MHRPCRTKKRDLRLNGDETDVEARELSRMKSEVHGDVKVRMYVCEGEDEEVHPAAMQISIRSRTSRTLERLPTARSRAFGISKSRATDRLSR